MSVAAFIRESNLIEGIERDPTVEEIAATEAFLALEKIKLDDVCALQAVYAPGKPLRDRVGMNVRVGGYFPPGGGRNITQDLFSLCERVNRRAHPDGSTGNPWKRHVEFEMLHPFMDGNGRTGRALWAWQMKHLGQDPFSLPFLHQFYYQTLANSEKS